MVKDIKVFTRPTCAPCKMLKNYLTYKGLKYSEVNVDEDSAAQEEAINLSGVSMVPLTVVTMDNGDQQVISGYNLSRLSQLANV